MTRGIEHRWEKTNLVLCYVVDIDQEHGPEDFHEMFVEHAQTAMRRALADSRTRRAAHRTAKNRKRRKSA